MGNNDQNTEEQNAIAYNPVLRDQLKDLHELLGDEISNIVAEAIEPGRKLSEQAEKALLAMSEGASKLTLELMAVRESKKKLNEEEQRNYDQIRNLAATLGNLQLKVSKILKIVSEITAMNVLLKGAAIDLTEDITAAQQQFREVRSGINDFGVFSQNPDLAYQLNERDHLNEGLL